MTFLWSFLRILLFPASNMVHKGIKGALIRTFVHHENEAELKNRLKPEKSRFLGCVNGLTTI